MQYLLASILQSLLLISVVQCSALSYDPDDYLEVYPDPRDSEALQGRTPLYFALIQSLGGPDSQVDGSGTLAGVKVALDRINNDSSLLPGYTLHYTFANSKCKRNVSLNALHSQLFHEPKKLAVIGSGCSVATEPTAEVSHYYNITQISCVSSSGLLGNRYRFPSYFQLLAKLENLAIGYYGVIRQYRWRRIALIVQDENVWTAAMNPLKTLLDENNVEYTEKLFNTSAGIKGLGPNPFDENSRIYLLSMYSIPALPFLCEAYYRGIHYPKYIVMTLGRFRRFWWRQEVEGLTCTADQRESVLPSSLAFSESYFLDEEKDANVTTTSGMTGAEFFAEERRYIGQPPLNITYLQYSQYCHDATWTLVYALNKTLNSLNDSAVNEELACGFNVTPPFRLKKFTYSNHKLMDVMFQHLSNTSFNGITGPVSFGDQGIRKLNNITIFQFRKRTNVTDGSTYLDKVEIGKVDESFHFTYVAGENVNTVWQGGIIPYDGVPREEIVTVHPALPAVYINLGCTGIMFAIACLIFNFLCRNAKLIKIASTKLNYLIGIGAIILYLNIIFFVIPTTSPDVVNGFCNLTPWLTAIGYSLCYGTILAKMARVYYIFSNPSSKKKIMKDKFLMLGVAVLVAIDLIILVVYTLVEGIRGNLVAKKVTHRRMPTTIEGELGIITNNFIYICDSTARDIFLGILYGYKMVLQIIALVLAFATRKVKVKGLDDAKFIVVTVYVTSIVLAVTILATYSLKEVINGFAALFCTGFLIGTTVILGLVFVPLMVGLYKDPKGDSIFERSSVAASYSHHSTGITREDGSSNNNSEVPGLRKRIKELEDEVKELKTIRGKLEETSVNSEPVLLSVLQTPHGTMCDTTEEQANAGNNTVHKKMEE